MAPKWPPAKKKKNWQNNLKLILYTTFNCKMLTFGPFKKELGFWTQLIKVNILSNNFGKNFKYPGAICMEGSSQVTLKVSY